MQCTNPVLIRNPKAVLGDPLSFGLWVPCGKCVSCRMARAREWSTRMLHELSYWEKAGFFTLTYTDDNLPFASQVSYLQFLNEPDEVVRREVYARGSSLCKRDLQLFFKRLRKAIDPNQIKYYACGEYGEKNGRAHCHAIIFGLDDTDVPLVESCWAYGNVHCGTVTYDSCRYVADYVGKSYSGALALEIYGHRTIPFQIQSRGIGLRYAEDNKDKIIYQEGITIHGAQVGIPRYYKKKLELDLSDKAVEHEDQLYEHYYKRQGVTSEAELAYALKKARKQADLNVKTRGNIYNRDKF